MAVTEIIKGKCFKCSRHLELEHVVVGMHFAVYTLHCPICKIEVGGSSKAEVGVEWLKLNAEYEQYLDKLTYEQFNRIKGRFL